MAIEVVRQDDVGWTEINIYPEPAKPSGYRPGYRVVCFDRDIGKEEFMVITPAVAPEPVLSLLGFNGNVDDLSAYILELQEVERQARALREEKHAAFAAWQEGLKGKQNG